MAGKLAWVHSASSGRFVLGTVHPKRGKDGMDAAWAWQAMDALPELKRAADAARRGPADGPAFPAARQS